MDSTPAAAAQAVDAPAVDRHPVLARYAAVIDEHRAVLNSLDAAELEAAIGAILSARAVFFTGQGRSGNMNRALAIRLMHIGIAVHVAGEPSTPSIGAGDLLIAVSASGTTKATLEHVAIARRQQAAVLLVTTRRPAGDDAPATLTIPVRHGVVTDQHAGSLFEQAVLLLGDSLAWQVQQRRGVADSVLNARHANLQ